MKQKSEKTCYAKYVDQMFCHSWISFMWHQGQMSAPIKCQMIETRIRPSGCKDRHFSSYTIKKAQLSAHKYNKEQATALPRGPNYTLKSNL